MADRVVPVRLQENLFDLMEEYRKQRNAKSKGDHQTRSAWIREAIREKIAHALRGRKKKRGECVTCHVCLILITKNEIAFSEHLLTGKKLYTCKSCDTIKGTKTPPPPLDQGATSNGLPETKLG